MKSCCLISSCPLPKGRALVRLENNLKKQLRILLALGFDVFICGVSGGIDMLFCMSILELMVKSPDIKIIIEDSMEYLLTNSSVCITCDNGYTENLERVKRRGINILFI